MTPHLDDPRARRNGLTLEYELLGSGEPVVLIHWGISAAWAEPLMDELALAHRCRVLRYHRAGFAGSNRIEGPLSLADHAAHYARLMRYLGIERAHLVGHSSSADIALQLALDFPDAVHTLALMEPARPVPPTNRQAQFVRDLLRGTRDSALPAGAAAASCSPMAGPTRPDVHPVRTAFPLVRVA